MDSQTESDDVAARSGEARRDVRREVMRDPLLSPGSWVGHTDETVTFCEALVEMLLGLGVQRAFGIVGGANTPFVQTLERSPVDVLQFKHEGGAAFAAAEAYFESGAPTVVFVTTGPGLLNALTGVAAARYDGAKVIVVSGATAAAQRHRIGIQESHSDTLPPDLYTSGKTFDYGCRIEDAVELEEAYARIMRGLQQRGSFVAHLAVPMSLQLSTTKRANRRPRLRLCQPAAPADVVDEIAAILQTSRFALWLGHGARHSAGSIAELAHRCSAPVICSARAKGVFDENDPLFAGHTGVGGSSGAEYCGRANLERILVLGSRLGEGSSFWDSRLAPSRGFIHVDVNPSIVAAAFPTVDAIGIQSEIGELVASLLERLAPREAWAPECTPPRLPADAKPMAGDANVRPTFLMREVQSVIVDGSDALVMSEAGNAFSWANEYLRFPTSDRYRTSSSYGSMGHFCAGVVGAALCRRRKCVVLTGDGALLMNNEINTAVTAGCSAVWIVLNDARYGMVEHGTQLFGKTRIETRTTRVDFCALAQSLGARGFTVKAETELRPALEAAQRANGPVVVDVWIDEQEVAPLIMSRGASLIKQS